MAGSLMLENIGYSVVTATNGLVALERLDEYPFDLVVMDIQMPVMDGVLATKRIRESDAPYASIPIIAMTAYAMKGDSQEFLAAGLDDAISKPVNMDEFEAVIKREMAKKRSTATKVAASN